MDRRKFVAAIGTVGSVAIAGCSGDSNESNGGDTNGNNQEEIVTHSIGDTFSVGEGDRVIEYTIHSAETYNTLGGEFSEEEPDGIFLVVEIDLTNQSEESFSISTRAYSVLDSNDNSFSPDSGAGIYVDQDDRIGADSIVFEQLNPGLSTEGALIFDVPEGEEVRLEIEPTGWLDTSDNHIVELGST